MFNLLYLNKYAGKIVGVTTLADTTSGYKKDKIKFDGKLTNENYNQMLGLYIGRFRMGDFFLDHKEWIPYLGHEMTIWDIEETDTGKKLLTHEQVGEKEFLVIGPNGMKRGRIEGLEIPYRTPYREILHKMKKGAVGKEYDEEMKKRDNAFKEWKRSIFFDESK